MIQHESSAEISKPLGAVFAFADDVSQTPRWLAECVEVRQTSPGPKAVGTELHYVHRRGGRRGEMDGVVTAYEKDRRLAMTYADKMFAVGIEFGFTPAANGTVVMHRCTITPKTFIGRLMSPLIRAANRKQVSNNLARLKRVLEEQR